MTDVAADEVPSTPIAPETSAEASSPDGVEVSGAPATERSLPPIGHPIGPLRQAILDHLLDSVDAGPQSVAQILAAMPPGTSRNNCESAIKREFDAGRIERVSPGHYVLAPPKSPEPPRPPPTAAVKVLEMAAGFAWPDALAGMTEEEWFAALEAWHADPSTWDTDKLGSPPNQPSNRVPMGIMLRFKDRLRKREDRRKTAEEAAARQADADRELRDQLIAACHGNFITGPGLDDVAPIRAAMENVSLDTILPAIRYKTDKKCFPGNEPATSWREERLLKSIATLFCERVLIPNMVDAWGSAGKALGRPAGGPDAGAGTCECGPA